MIVYIGLGANLGDRLQSIRSAVKRLGAVGEVTAVSSVYETQAVGPPQPDYLNAVVELETDLGPQELLAACRRIESELGRRPSGQRWGPREIDLDILAIVGTTVDTPDLVVPHPELLNRAFVLVPLAEIAPDLDLAGTPVSALAAAHAGHVTRFASLTRS